MKRRSVIYAPEARADLDWIYDTIADASDPVTTDRYDTRLRAFCERLEVGAERGRPRDDVRPSLRIIGFERRVSVAFTVDDERVTVLRLFYGGADWENAL